MQEPLCCHDSELFQATPTLLPSLPVEERDQPKQEEDILKVSLLESSECRKMFSELHPSVPKGYYKELFLSPTNLISVQNKELMQEKYIYLWTVFELTV